MAKAKISVTVESSVIRDCARFAKGRSRSEIVERALTSWLRDVRRKSLEEEVERYYTSLSPADRQEDSRWAGLASRFLGESWG